MLFLVNCVYTFSPTTSIGITLNVRVSVFPFLARLTCLDKNRFYFDFISPLFFLSLSTCIEESFDTTSYMI